LKLEPKKYKKRKPFTLEELPDKPGIYGLILKLIGMHRNLLLIGTHGVGKTQMVMGAAEELKLKVKYFSAATMDPYADLAGIPVVDRKKKAIEFIHDSDLDKYHIFFFDELNRPHDDKVLNGLLEAVQFLQVQGRPFTKLVSCIAAMNPPDMAYQVDDVDPALLDRFHHYLEVPFEYHPGFYKNKFGTPLANILLSWAHSLSKDKQAHVTPRRLEYIGDTITITKNNLDILKTTVLSGTIPDTDFSILHGKCASLFPGIGEQRLNDQSKKATSLIERQAQASANDMEAALQRLRDLG